MANQEGVKIVITAEDKFSETIKRIEASTKIFGETAKNTERHMAALEKEMVRLVANGLNPADKKIVEMKANYDKLSQSLNNGQGSLKESNKKWTSLALVVQDLPYGFRGIQNNLPALFGSIAAAAGPAYLAFSALIALITAYEKEIKALFITTTEAEKKQQLYNNVVKESGSAYVDAQTQVLSLTEKVRLAKEGYIDKQSVVNDYNDALGKTIGKQKDLEGVNQALINQGPAYVDYMNKLAMATAAAKLVAQETENIVKTSAKSAGEFVDGWDAFFSAKFNIGGLAQSMIASSQAALKVGEKAKKSQLTLAEKTRTAYVKIMEEMYTAAGIAAKKAGVIPGVDKEGLAALENAAKERLKAIKDANDAEVNAFVKTLDERGQKEYKAGLELADNLEKMRAAGYTDSTTYYAAYRAEMDKIAQYYNNKEIEEARKTSEKIAKDAEAADNRQLQNSLDALKIQSDVAMKIANASGKATSADRIKILQQYKNSLYDLASIGGWTAEQLDKIDDAIVRVDGAIEGSKDNLRDFKISWTDTMNSINKTIIDFVANSVNFLAESIGKALAGENIEVFKGLALILAESLIDLGKALVAYAVPVLLTLTLLKKPSIPTALAAIGAGIAAIAAGTLLKSKLSADKTQKFANGGIVSGPTYGLMGEYPGAASNPEVVAPLDKLKDMIGGGVGTLEARISGNDLLILMNKANRNNQNTF